MFKVTLSTAEHGPLLTTTKPYTTAVAAIKAASVWGFCGEWGARIGVEENDVEIFSAWGATVAEAVTTAQAMNKKSRRCGGR